MNTYSSVTATAACGPPPPYLTILAPDVTPLITFQANEVSLPIFLTMPWTSRDREGRQGLNSNFAMNCVFGEIPGPLLGADKV